MLVDHEIDESTAKPYVKEGLSTPDRPSGPLLEEMPSVHAATNIDQPIDIDPLNINTRTMPMLESAVIIETTFASTEENIPQQSRIIMEEIEIVSVQSKNSNILANITEINLIS